MTRQAVAMLRGAALILVGILLVWFAGPQHGVNGFTVLGVIVAVVGLATVERAGDR